MIIIKFCYNKNFVDLYTFTLKIYLFQKNIAEIMSKDYLLMIQDYHFRLWYLNVIKVAISSYMPVSKETAIYIFRSKKWIKVTCISQRRSFRFACICMRDYLFFRIAFRINVCKI